MDPGGINMPYSGQTGNGGLKEGGRGFGDEELKGP